MYLGPEPPDDPNDVFEHGILGQKRKAVSSTSWRPEVEARAKYWRAPVQGAGSQQLLAPDQPQSLPSSGPMRFCLLRRGRATDTPPRRPAPDQDGEELSVFVIGMGRDHQHPLGVPEHPLGLPKRHGAAGRGTQRLLRGEGGRGEHEQQRRPEIPLEARKRGQALSRGSRPGLPNREVAGRLHVCG